MPVLTPTKLYGTVTWLGLVADSETSIAAVATDGVDAGWEGFAGDCHAGLNRPSCVRVRTQYPRAGTEIRNVRQISILSVEELAEIASRLGVPEVRPEWVGASMVVEGIPDFTLVPPSSRLMFDNGAGLVIDMENAPCRHPAELIEAAHPGHGLAFPKIAQHKRGVTAWVEHPGRIETGMQFRLHIPPQRHYAHA